MKILREDLGRQQRWWWDNLPVITHTHIPKKNNKKEHISYLTNPSINRTTLTMMTRANGADMTTWQRFRFRLCIIITRTCKLREWVSRAATKCTCGVLQFTSIGRLIGFVRHNNIAQHCPQSASHSPAMQFIIFTGRPRSSNPPKAITKIGCHQKRFAHILCTHLHYNTNGFAWFCWSTLNVKRALRTPVGVGIYVQYIYIVESGRRAFKCAACANY